MDYNKVYQKLKQINSVLDFIKENDIPLYTEYSDELYFYILDLDTYVYINYEFISICDNRICTHQINHSVYIESAWRDYDFIHVSNKTLVLNIDKKFLIGDSTKDKLYDFPQTKDERFTLSTVVDVPPDEVLNEYLDIKSKHLIVFDIVKL